MTKSGDGLSITNISGIEFNGYAATKVTISKSGIMKLYYNDGDNMVMTFDFEFYTKKGGNNILNYITKEEVK